MLVYFSIILFLICASALKFNKLLYVFAFLLLLAVGGLRDISVGIDAQQYKAAYFGYNANIKGTEYGWHLLNIFVLHYFKNYQVFIFISMLLILYPVFYVVKKISNNPFLSIALFCLLYFYFNSFNIIRQSIAGSLVFVALYLLFDNHRIGYLIFIILASLFHTTALFCLLVYPFYFIDSTKKPLIIIIVISYFVGALNLPLGLLHWLNFGPLYSTYLGVLPVTYSFSITRLLLNIALLCVVNWGDHKDLFVKNFIFGVFLLNIFSFSPDIARIAQYFLLSQIIIIPNLRLPFAPKFQKLGQEIGLLYAILVFLFFISHNIAGVLPYKICF